ncbi:MAG: malonyl-CoA decarboxylase [Alphaproteobacteria bacterium]
MSQMVDAIADLGRLYFERPSNENPLEAAHRLCADLLSEHGEASGTALAREVVELYGGLERDDRIAFLDMLNNDFACDTDGLGDAIARYSSDASQDAYLALCRAVEAPRQELLHRINAAPNGTAAIVEMRALLLETLKDQPDFATLDADFGHLFASWFNRGFLQFERIDWRTPAATLEKLIKYEAVHEIRGWTDLRRRLADDRRCFAFFHPALIDEPLIFVEVALVQGLAARIEPVLDAPPPEADGEAPDTAVFYSISNCQAGLAGISFGNLLIKQVVDALNAELPEIRNFVTLSPIPGFHGWVDELMVDTPSDFLDDEERAMLADANWSEDPAIRDRLEKPLMRLCAEFLTNPLDDGPPRDTVARFHLGNGASVERLNWGADLSPKGLAQSAGIMVNYRYDPDKIVANHEAYVGEGRIAISSSVRALASARR